MVSVASRGTARRIAARILLKALRAGSGTLARYSATFFGAPFPLAVEPLDFFFSTPKSIAKRRCALVRSIALGRDFIAGSFKRARTAPAPDQDDVLAAGVVKPVPVAPWRENNVSLSGGLAAGVRINEAPALKDDEKFVGVGMAVLVVARTRRKNGPADEELV